MSTTMFVNDLLGYLFDGQAHPLTQPMATWLAASRRFTSFVTTFRDKIRKKLRVTRDPESLLDLRLELETAYLLLQERTLSLVYEPEQSRLIRSPDFAVSFTTSLTFTVEVTRLQADNKALSGATRELAPANSTPNQPTNARLTDAICSKLGQMLPQRSNVLLVGIETMEGIPQDLRATMLQVQQRAERNDVVFLQRHRFRDRADFFQHYQRLSTVLVRGAKLKAGSNMIDWANPQARHPLPAQVRTALSRSHTLAPAG